MFTLGPFDYVVVALFAIRRIGIRRTLFAALGVGAFMYVWTPRPCSCIRMPLTRCIYRSPYESAVKSDVRNLASQQEIFYADVYRYSDDPAELGFVPSRGVSVTITAMDRGWSAWMTHETFEPWKGCLISEGVYVAGQDRDDPAAPASGVHCNF